MSVGGFCPASWLRRPEADAKLVQLKTLLAAHASTPFNPAIANVFFRSGEIETWGRGIERILAACKGAARQLLALPESLRPLNPA